MYISFDLSALHKVVAANSHFYAKPTEPLYLNRTLRYHDLIYLCEGEWAITELESEYTLKKDDVLLLPAGHHHYTRLPCAPNTQTFCIHISCEPGDLNATDRAVTLPICMNVHKHPIIREEFRQITSTYWSNKSHKDERLSTLFNTLILDLLDIYKSELLLENDLGEQIISLVNHMSHNRYSTKEMADMFHVSTKTIDAVISKKTGLSFSKYQNARKLEMVALQLAVEPDVKLSEIASTFAFYDEFHLSRAFKQKYGMSPSQYRQNLNPKK